MSRAKPRSREERRPASARPPASVGTALSGPAARLLAALSQPGAAARPDPADEAAVILSVKAASVSLGRGTFPLAAAQELCRHDLAVAAAGPGRGPSFSISEAGRAHLRRSTAAKAGADAFAIQQRETVSTTIPDPSGPVRVAINANESPLAWLRRRRDRDGEWLIGPAEFEAGERLRRDLTVAGLLPSVTARWEGAIGAGAGPRDPAGATDAVVAARQRVRGALTAVGADFADLLTDLCGFLKGLETIERDRGWPARSGKVVLRLALKRLAEHYGLEGEARGLPRPRGIESWVASGGV